MENRGMRVAFEVHRTRSKYQCRGLHRSSVAEASAPYPSR